MPNPMKIQQLIEEQKRGLDELLEGGRLTLEGNGITPVDVTQEIKSFMKSYGRKLIEAVGEEIMDVAIDQKDECPIVYDVLRQQRLKLKEILSNIK